MLDWLRRGADEVPVIELAHLSEAQKRAYVLADNRLAEQAGWDREMLALEVADRIHVMFRGSLSGAFAAPFDRNEIGLAMAGSMPGMTPSGAEAHV